MYAIGDEVRQVIGLHSVREVFKVRPRAIQELWLKSDWEKNHELREFGELAKKLKIRVTEKPFGAFDKLGSGHQGVMAMVNQDPEWDLEAWSEQEHSILIALDEVEDPHNVGSIMRSGWLFGAQGILVPQHRSAHLTPSVMKVASGGAEHVGFAIESNLPQSLKELKDKNYWVMGCVASPEAKSLWSLNLPEKLVWVIGSEDKGIRSSVLNECDEQVYIPQVDAAASLNASVAAAVVFAETVRQWKTHGKFKK